jgi:type I restriction enzyme S subunit
MMNSLETIQKSDLPSGWRVVELGNVLNIQSSKRIFAKEYMNSGVAFFRSKEIIEKHKGNMISTPLYISENRFKEIENKFGVPKRNDILLTSVGTLGVPYKVQKDEIFYFKDGNLTWFKEYKDCISPDFLYIWFTSLSAKQAIDNITIGSTQQAITISALKTIKINLPPLPEQKAIAHILGKLDDKIALNRQINQTLETMVQTLFKSWFVNFDPVIDNALKAGNPIPDSLKTQAEKRKTTRSTLPKTTQNLFPNRFVFNDKLKKWIPEGWEVKNLGKVGKVVCGKTPSKSKKEYYGGNTLFVKIPNMHNEVYVLETNEYLTELGSKSQLNKRIPRGSIAVSCIATVGKVVLIDKESHTNQQINSIIPNQSYYQYYLYFLMLSLNGHFHSLASSGSATLNMNTSTFSDIEITMPSNHILKTYDKQVKSNFETILFNQKQTQTLTKLRDTLLPKLISGKIQVKNYKQIVN